MRLFLLRESYPVYLLVNKLNQMLKNFSKKAIFFLLYFFLITIFCYKKAEVVNAQNNESLVVNGSFEQ
ncbi:MAG: hypothetical protein ACPLYC_01360, partial [Minisyncoccia bacterium]